MVSLSPSPLRTFRGRFTESHATRLLWRAGFGPQPGEAARLAALGLDGAVASLTRPSGRAQLIGEPPHSKGDRPLDPIDVWGDDHCWWLDRMVRSTHQLQERMTLIWHSWFATSVDASSQAMMLAQNRMMRSHWLGNFHDLFIDVTRDPAMLLWLNGTSNNKWSPNENYGREMMELFSLGFDRGYDQADVEEQARALTGFTNKWSDARGSYDFHFDPDLHDDGVKTIFGHKGRFDWRDSVRLCVQHWSHPTFMVSKLWGFFISDEISSDDLKVLARVYVRSGYETRPVVEAILRHPLFYEGQRMVTPPVVFCAGLLRATHQTVQTDSWAWIGDLSGQKLFEPPNVSGWDYASWLDTSRWAGRLDAVNQALDKDVLTISRDKHYPATETPEQALDRALAYWSGPELSGQTHGNLLGYAKTTAHEIHNVSEQIPYRLLRQNGLRALIPMSPDWQTS
jgi:uncharacterized protein (DUF1800 family)